jgi:hypothetical protein
MQTLLHHVILAIDTRNHTAVLLEPEQEHSEECPEDEEVPCGCPVDHYDILSLGHCTTQEARFDFVTQALECAGAGHNEDCDESGDCDCDTSPIVPVLVVTDDEADPETWGRWLAELEHGALNNIARPALHDLFPGILGDVNLLAQERLDGPPMGVEVALAMYLGTWAQTRELPEAAE